MACYSCGRASSPYYSVGYSSGYMPSDPMHEPMPYSRMPRFDYGGLPGSLATKGNYE